ncbi:MAG: cysteine desulfurase [Anaerolineaceae bacterium]|nr:cysteine desulfurase [Anaerolineaceae bacterium]
MTNRSGRDLAEIRADFPILAEEHHDGVPLVFLDSAASSQKPQAVIGAIADYYRHTHANVHRGIHKLSEAATAAFEDARRKVRRFINAESRREIIFTRNTTESINLVAQSWGRSQLKPGDVVISTVLEHHSNIVPWQILAEDIGFTLRFLPVREQGQLDLAEYERILREERVRLVTVAHVSNVLGTVNPIAAMAEKAHDSGALILVDGAQSVPHMPVDVRALNVDFYAFSGHKMLGPTGVGVLYGKRDLLQAMPPWMGGGDMISHVSLDGSSWNELPYKFEAGTPAIAPVIGLGAAVQYLQELGMEWVHAYEQQLTAYALERLSEVPQLELFGPSAAKEKGGVAAFRLADHHPHDVAQLLDAQGIAVRAGHHCAQPLHHHLGVPSTTRASFYIYNTEEEIDALVAGLYETLRILG